MTDLLGPTLADLVAYVRDTLKDCGCDVAQSGILPGNTVSWDNCCDGQLWGRVVSAEPQYGGPGGCQITDWRVRAAVGVVRCMAGLDSDGAAPSQEQMNCDTLQMTRDADLLAQALSTWPVRPDLVAPRSLRIETGLPQGPQGLCGGWEWTFTFRLMQCYGC